MWNLPSGFIKPLQSPAPAHAHDAATSLTRFAKPLWTSTSLSSDSFFSVSRPELPLLGRSSSRLSRVTGPPPPSYSAPPSSVFISVASHLCRISPLPWVFFILIDSGLACGGGWVRLPASSTGLALCNSGRHLRRAELQIEKARSLQWWDLDNLHIWAFTYQIFTKWPQNFWILYLCPSSSEMFSIWPITFEIADLITDFRPRLLIVYSKPC